MKRFSVRDCWGVHHERGLGHRSRCDSGTECETSPNRSCVGDGELSPESIPLNEFGFYERVRAWADHSRCDSGTDLPVSTPLSSPVDGGTLNSEFSDTSSSGADIVSSYAADGSYAGFVESRYSDSI